MSNADCIREIYAAFLRGDVEAIVAQTADDVEWEYGSISVDLPWLKHRRGHAGVREFFGSLAAIKITKFDPHSILESKNLVVGLVNLEAIVQRTGRTFVEEDEVHIFEFDSAGKIRRFRHRIDTYLQWMAWQI